MTSIQGDESFAATRWSLVVAAGGAGGAADTPARAALEELARAYWFPLYAYIRRQGNSRGESEDLTQEFFALLIEKRFLTSVDSAKGRFRAFLLACVNHFLSNQRDRERALKRGGGKRVLSLEAAEARYEREVVGGAETLTPEKLFERRWALAVLDRVLVRLEGDYRRADQGAVYAELKELLTGAGERSHAERAEKLGMTEAAVKVAAHRLRGRYRELLKEEIGQTVATEAEVGEEIAYLLKCL